jgi:hypothetical protein
LKGQGTGLKDRTVQIGIKNPAELEAPTGFFLLAVAGSGQKIDDSAYAGLPADLDGALPRQPVRRRLIESQSGEVEIEDDGTARLVVDNNEFIGGGVLKRRSKAFAAFAGTQRNESPHPGIPREGDAPVGVCRRYGAVDSHNIPVQLPL